MRFYNVVNKHQEEKTLQRQTDELYNKRKISCLYCFLQNTRFQFAKFSEKRGK